MTAIVKEPITTIYAREIATLRARVKELEAALKKIADGEVAYSDDIACAALGRKE